jgi:large subunit ribosomal protein L2
MNHLNYASRKEYLRSETNLSSIFKHSLRFKPLTTRIKSNVGRSYGRIVCPRRGFYNKRIYRFIDFARNTLPEQKSLVLLEAYDPMRTARICLLCYPIGIIAYILKPVLLQKGDVITTYTSTPTRYGDSASLLNLPSGILIHNIAGKFTRSAGCSTILVRKDFDQTLVKLKSGELRFFNSSVVASFGTIGNESHFIKDYKRAGVIRRLGFRPRVRPSSMNPVDHPMGGRTRGGQPTNKKGIITLNRSTVKNHHISILYTKRQLKLIRH